jgi:hypothetical protein
VRALELTPLDEPLAVCRLEPRAGLPSWGDPTTFLSCTWTASELSVVAPERVVPEGVRCERGWRALRVCGPLDFSQVGVLASLVVPLAERAVSVFVVSTFETDYLLVRDRQLDAAIEVLLEAGHRLRPESA